MNIYVVVYYNRFANQTQTFSVTAKNKFRAGREFYRKHDRKIYHKGIVERITHIAEVRIESTGAYR